MRIDALEFESQNCRLQARSYVGRPEGLRVTGSARMAEDVAAEIARSPDGLATAGASGASASVTCQPA